MPDKRLVAIVTALMLSTSALTVRADATLEQLQTIDRLLNANDTRALWYYMQQNPELLAGNDELALELRKFCNDVTLGRLRCHYVPNSRDSDGGGVASTSGFSGIARGSTSSSSRGGRAASASAGFGAVLSAGAASY